MIIKFIIIFGIALFFIVILGFITLAMDEVYIKNLKKEEESNTEKDLKFS